MADKTNTLNRENQTMQHEQAKASVSPEKDRQKEESRLDKDRQEKSAVGGKHPADKQGEFSKDRESGQSREPSQNR